MTIAYIYNSFTFYGGIERVLINKMNYLAEVYDYRLILISYAQLNRPIVYPLSPKIKSIDYNIPIYLQYRYNPLRRLSYYFRLRNLLVSQLRQLVKEEQIDIMVGTTYEFFIMDVLNHLRGEVKTVLETHISKKYIQDQTRDSFLKNIFYVFRVRRINQIVRNASAFVTLTDLDANEWIKVRRCIVIPNAAFIIAEQDYSQHKEYKRVISVGRMDWQKGYDLLLKSWSHVVNKHTDWHLDIYGDGRNKSTFLSLCRKMELETSVTFMAATKDIYQKYKDYDFYVMSSRYEGFGMVLVEAMSNGLPCVSFDCPYGPSNIIHDNIDGFLIKNGDIDGLAEKISYMIEHQDIRLEMGKNAFLNVNRYSPSKIMPLWRNLFENL